MIGKKLWKLNNLVFTRCGQLHDVSEYIDKTNIEESNNILLIVGCNDLDQKNHEQVFGEMVTILDQIRNKYKNNKFIISEITPRNDNRDNEVKCFNSVLVNYAEDHSDENCSIPSQPK